MGLIAQRSHKGLHHCYTAVTPGCTVTPGYTHGHTLVNYPSAVPRTYSGVWDVTRTLIP
jgi:hypothetical protein